MDGRGTDGDGHVGDDWREARLTRCSLATKSVLAPVDGLRRRWRRLTAPLRVLPDFVIVGAQKAGTTSLYAYLTAQPDVLPATAKEVHFFDSCEWDRGAQTYRAYFPTRARVRLRSAMRSRPTLTGEATPYYLYHPLAPERLAATAPQTKVIILLRDPVERTLSHYWHEVRGGREHLPLRAALEAEPARLRGREEALQNGAPQCRHRDHQVFSYVDRSRYSRQVGRYLALFPREQVLVLRSELLFGDDAETIERLAEFLRLPRLTGRFAEKNLGRRQSRDPEEAAVRGLLADTLADEEAALRELLGDTFTWTADLPAADEAAWARKAGKLSRA
jgi:hypothetical protein